MENIFISCVGDFLPADTAYTLGSGIGSNLNGLLEYYSLKDNKLFNNSDIVFCNLEAPLINDPKLSHSSFAGNPEVTRLMKMLGINLISLSNNHIPDHGKEGINNTIKLLSEDGFYQIGNKKGDISDIVFINCKGKKIAFAGFNAIMDHPEDNILATIEKNILYNTLQEIKNLFVDYIIFSFHWGDEYMTYPSPKQVELAHELIDEGVNIIIGHHPHVVQPVEHYKGGVILYSLGNFIFDMFWSERVHHSMQVDIVLHKDNSIDYQIKPFRIRTDFTQDFNHTGTTFSILSKANKKFELLKAMSYEVYLRTYNRDRRKNKLLSRIQMKLYLLKNLLQLSPQSRNMLIRNIKMKLKLFWTKK